jgi:hypothetical protein
VGKFSYILASGQTVGVQWLSDSEQSLGKQAEEWQNITAVQYMYVQMWRQETLLPLWRSSVMYTVIWKVTNVAERK